MTLYVCQFPHAVTLLVDADDEDEAKAIATETAEGDAPRRVVALAPGVFVAELVEGEDEDGETLIEVDPLEHTAAVLAVVEAGGSSGDVSAAGDDACGASADANGEAVFCALDRGHDGEHEATTAGGEVVAW